MALGNIAYVSITHGQGNDDVKSYAGSSHLTSVTEVEKVAEVLSYNGEFGERGYSLTRYEQAPATVVAFTAGEQSAQRGRLKLELVHESAVAGETGKKTYIEIADFFNDSALVVGIQDGIKLLAAGTWAGINQKVATVNVSFTARKS